MSVMLPEVRIGDSLRCGGLTLFPLFGGLPFLSNGGGIIDYAVAHAGMEQGTVTVREVSEAGSVCELLAENLGDRQVLFIEGEELRGAKQNRVLAASVLVGARTETTIPVFCTEHGRWVRGTGHFVAGSYCPPSLRCLLMAGRRDSALLRARNRPSQVSLWRQIRHKHHVLDFLSKTEDMAAALQARRDEVERLRTQFPCPADANGIAIAVADQVVLDVFDKPTTLQQVWDRMVAGLALDLTESRDEERPPSRDDVLSQLYRVRQLEFTQVPQVGLGEGYHVQHDDGTIGNALVVDGVVVHFSLAWTQHPVTGSGV
jgi:hypothetical protein